jgi:hypothetical protein
MVPPPVLKGAVNVMVAWVLPDVADRLVGGLGTVYGVTVVVCDEVLAPALFTACRAIV